MIYSERNKKFEILGEINDILYRTIPPPSGTAFDEFGIIPCYQREQYNKWKTLSSSLRDLIIADERELKKYRSNDPHHDDFKGCTGL